MSEAPFRIEPLSDHDRSEFDCGVDALNAYLARQVGQDRRRRMSFCFVAVEQATRRVAGYYTLSATGIELSDLPPDIQKRLPRYPSVPAVRIGRLAVDQRYRGQRLGGALLFDAIQRTVASDIAAFAVIVDAKDDIAAAFYSHFGFQPLTNKPLKLFLPIGEALRELAFQRP
ncbi:MAG: GNAT family N-acetyltransferase [Phycisphaerales bacterium]|nr:GNAT family N-acetyltransferase [Phycisphaerales bacterium]